MSAIRPLWEALAEAEVAAATEERQPLPQDIAERCGRMLVDEYPELAADAMLEPAQRGAIMAALGSFLRALRPELPAELHEAWLTALGHHLLGFGPLQPLIDDETVTEIMVTGPDQVWIERGGRIEPVPGIELSSGQLLNIIQRIAYYMSRPLHERAPRLDARLPSGARVNALIPPASQRHPRLTIRRHPHRVFAPERWLAEGSASAALLSDLAAWVRAKLNVLVIGPTGSGKTSLLQVLAHYIPAQERVLCIESTAELQLWRILPHVIASEATATMSVYDLLVNGLWERPDRIVVGEVREREAHTMIEAAATGHEGLLCTLHAGSPVDALARLARLMRRETGETVGTRELIEQLVATLDVCVTVRRFADGRRRIVEVAEYAPELDASGAPRTRRLWHWEPRARQYVRAGELTRPPALTKRAWAAEEAGA